MKYLSLYSGIEAASVAWEPLGWEPMAFAEFEAFPSAVLAHHFPATPNLGDVTAVDWERWFAENGRPDVMVAGSPCQAFSVAGQRRSLEDARGNLALFTAELVRYLNPRVYVWENVPGRASRGHSRSPSSPCGCGTASPPSSGDSSPARSSTAACTPQTYGGSCDDLPAWHRSEALPNNLSALPRDRRGIA